MGQGIAAEDAVQRVEESSPQAQQNTSQGDGQAAGENAAHQGAAHQGQQQGQELLFCHRLFPQNSRQNHHKGGRRI